MQVYVLNQQSKPLMPCTPAKARRLLRDQKAKVVKRTPFTIQLLYGSSGYKQPITLGIDTGSKVIGLSAVTEKKEVFSGELFLRNDIVELLSNRRAYRNHRRYSKTRYRPIRFLNRVSSKKLGWLAPSVRYKIEAHERIIKKLHEILPISKIIVEVASFDIRKIQNPEIQGRQYQEGPQKDFYNVRAYVLHRDGYKCHGKSGCKNKILQVHHIESRKTGGNAPNNLISLCKECHTAYHNGNLKLNLIRGRSFKDAAFIGIMRKSLVVRLKSCYSVVEETYGYMTKSLRIKSKLEKSHRNDALCITGTPNVSRVSSKFLMKQVRKHNRQIHKSKILKGGIKKRSQAEYIVKGFRLFDKILYKGQELFVVSRRPTGKFVIGNIFNYVRINTTVKNIKLIEHRRTTLFQRIG